MTGLHVTAGQAGQMAVVLLVIAVLLYKLGFFRGFRAATKRRNTPLRYRSRAPRAVPYPAIDPNASDAVDRG